MFWCHSCSTEILCSHHCQSCLSQAIQEITNENNPKIYKPYVVQQQVDQPYFSLDSLYRNAYRDLFSAISQRRTQVVRRVDNNGAYSVSYVIVVDSSQDDEIKGLNEEEIQKLQKKIVNSQCSICQQIRECQGFTLECKHQFHQQCLTPWIKTNGTCPTCRFKLIKQ